MHWCLAWVLACTTPSPAPEPAPEPVVVQPDPEPLPRPDPMAWPRPTEAKLAATHVLIAWKGAKDAPPTVERTEDAALERARALHDRVAAGEHIEELARTESDDPSGRRGGRLGVWRTGVMDDGFERCTAQAAPGGLAPLCSSPFGYHVVRRDPILEARGRALVVELPAEADEATRATAMERAAALREALFGGEPLDAVVARADREIALGPTGGGQLLPALEAALFDGPAVSEVLEAPGGLYVVVRDGS